MCGSTWPSSAHPDAAEDRGAVGVRHQLEHLGGRDQLDVQADPRRPARGPAQVDQALLARGDAHAADALEDAELVVELDRCSGGSASSSATG